MQQVVVQIKPEQAGPVVARTARGIRESIVKSRAYMQMFFSITHFAKVAFKYLKSSAKRKTWKWYHRYILSVAFVTRMLKSIPKVINEVYFVVC